MNIKNGINSVSKAIKNAAGATVDAVGSGIGVVEGFTGEIGDKATGKIVKVTSNALANESVSGTKRKIAQAVNDNADRIGNAIGSGTQGAIIGATGGMVLGGISGGVNEDETFIGGALKGGLIGAAGGFTIGGASGFAHNNSSLLDNALFDANKVSKRISKWKVGMGDGIS